MYRLNVVRDGDIPCGCGFPIFSIIRLDDIKTSCNTCKIIYGGYDSSHNDEYIFADDANNHFLVMTYEGCDLDLKDTSCNHERCIKYCPDCGRKLNEEYTHRIKF